MSSVTDRPPPQGRTDLWLRSAIKKSRVHDYAYAVVQREEDGGVSIGAFKLLLELLDVDPQLPGAAPLPVRATSRSWKVFTNTEAVAALLLIVGCSGRDPMQFALHSGIIGGGGAASGARYFGVANPARRKMEV